MPSVKQVEAFYWSATLGSFVAAADRLNTTQSNISKRIQEMELTLKISVFDRTRRAIRLTAKGEELMRASELFLKAHNGVTAVGGSTGATGPFRFGVTEAVGLTWLPKLCAAITEAFPGLVPTSRVDTSTELNVLLRERKIDLAIGTRLRIDADFEVTELAQLDRVWLASPLLLPDTGNVLTPQEFASTPILGHGDVAAAEVMINRYLRGHGLSPNIVSSCTNLTALARMAAAGMGITYLHRGVFDDEIRLGRLREVRTEIVLPKLQYIAVHRDDPISPLTETIAQIAKDVCDFSWNGNLSAAKPVMT